MPQAWKPTPFVKLSILIHALAVVAWLLAPGWWLWALGAVVINQILLTVAGLLPRTTLLGPNLNRLPAAAVQRREIALTIDDGPDPLVTPRVLDLLDAAGAKASFFCIGRYADQYPALCQEIVVRGHSVENHGDSHSWIFALFGMGRMRADISAAQEKLGKITGRPPQFFRPTAGLRNPLLDPVLSRLGLKLASWTRRPYDTSEGDPQVVYDRLVVNLAAGDILLLHDGHAAPTADGEPVILVVLPRLLQLFAERRLIPVTLSAALK
ncbi:MAG: polysaccharide deacetylase family protein [Rhodocyclaceae bacterium]|nr:polysaccharide deacetylase family protein [Rhodocyclaceae bacterium]